MDNTQRRVRYLADRRGIDMFQAGALVRRAYREGTPDTAMFTPAQCRRLRHKRGTDDPGPAQLRRQAIRESRKARWDVLTPRPPGAPLTKLPPRDPDAPQTERDQSYLQRAEQKRANRAMRMLALMRRRSG